MLREPLEDKPGSIPDFACHADIVRTVYAVYKVERMDDRDEQRTSSLADRVYLDLRRQIVAGEIPPRALVQEARIARTTGASRTPVREALRRLEAEGKITRSAAGAYSVPELSPQELLDLYELRGILEGHAARLAAERRGRVELARLADVVDAMEQAIARQDDDLLASLNGMFHDLIAATSGSRYLQTQIRSIREHFESYRVPALSVRGRRESAFEEHKELMMAIVAQDWAAAERLGLAHVREAFKVRVAGSEGEHESEAIVSLAQSRVMRSTKNG